MRSAQIAVIAVSAWCFATSRASAGDCGDPHDVIVIESTSEGPSAPGAAIVLRVQALRRGRGAWPECIPPETSFDAAITVSVEAPDGTTTTLTSNDREVQVLPDQIGYYVVRASAPQNRPGPGEEPRQLIASRGFMVGHGDVEFRIPRAMGRVPRTLHFRAPGQDAPALMRPSRGRIRLPRIPGYWQAPVPGGLLYVHVGERVSFARADARLHIEAPHSPDLSIRVAAAGVPSQTLACTSGCETLVPRGVVHVHAVWDDDQRETHEVRVSRRRARLSLRGGDEGALPLSVLPRAESTGYDPSAACDDGVPLALGEQLLRAGAHLCERRRGRWVARSNWAHVGIDASPARSLVHDELAYLAAGRRGMVDVSVVGPQGHAREHIRVESDQRTCQVSELALGPEGLAIVGQCTAQDGTQGRGFLILRGHSGIRVVRTRRPLVHIVESGAAFVVSDSNSRLHRCTTRCRRLRQRVTSIAGLAQQEGAAIVVEESGAVRTIEGESLLIADPGWNLPISRIVRTGGELVALFGPEIVGSEYHPFCVRSIVATLSEEGRWIRRHVVESEEGRRLDCQDDETSPAVVLDIAAARGLIFARRQHVTRGETAFVPLTSSGVRVLVNTP